MTIACFHTAESNVALFNEAARAHGLAPTVLHHTIGADLLCEAEHAGGLTPAIAKQTRRRLEALADGADAVILNCSTLGPSLAPDDAARAVPLLRADAALAEQAVAGGDLLVVLCTLETTLASTTTLFQHVARKTGASCEVRLVAEAWPLFRAGDHARYHAAIAAAAEAAIAERPARLAFAQTSMTGAAQLLAPRFKVFTVPGASIEAAVSKAQTINLHR